MNASPVRHVGSVNPKSAGADSIPKLVRTSPGWITRVQARLIADLPDGPPQQNRVARSLHTSTRSLRRRLRKEGTSYARLLDDTRRELGVRYLRQTRLPVTEVALRLGFSETSSFSRAFRRWTGNAPRDFRIRRASY